MAKPKKIMPVVTGSYFDRHAFLTDNFRLVRWYAAKVASSWHRWRAGGLNELVSFLSVAYMQAFRSWIRKGRYCSFAGFACKAFDYALLKIEDSRAIVRLPGGPARAEAKRLCWPERFRFFGELPRREKDEHLASSYSFCKHDTGIDQEAVLQLVDKAAKLVPARYWLAVRCVVGLETGVPMTLLEAGQVLGVTRERVRQIVIRAIRLVRDRLLERGASLPNSLRELVLESQRRSE